ncbi:hypothetical protein ABZ957_19565, partial [Streptomyces sp. NPDC046316]|uniref:hypothetical protein n=1 Tax=Streptomyces sp. NPDC046316 TaxID=3154494 RepID=UPI0033EF32E4
MTTRSAAPSEDGTRSEDDSDAGCVHVSEDGLDAKGGPMPEADSDTEGVSVSEDVLDAKDGPNVQGGSDAEDRRQTEDRADAAPSAHDIGRSVALRHEVDDLHGAGARL